MRSHMEHQYTSTGVKFWRHPKQMNAYREGTGHTAISTHISPTGRCNLDCSYCSVKRRDSRANDLPLETIQSYISLLLLRGLKAVILTGGGEPLLHPQINELVEWLWQKGLKIGLITNGTVSHLLKQEAWRHFSWVRVSLNMKHVDRIALPMGLLDHYCTIGASLICDPHPTDEELRTVAWAIARLLDLRYVRLLPNCLLGQEQLEEEHRWIAEKIKWLRERVCSNLFFHQNKNHRAPSCAICHQSYFRPYLSEVNYWKTGAPGSVYPCDSVVLNAKAEKFQEQYQLCGPEEVGMFMDGELIQRFDAREDCTGCVFTDTVEMLGRWERYGTVDATVSHEKPQDHEEFV